MALKEAIAAIITWTTDPSLEREAIWLQTTNGVPLGDNTDFSRQIPNFSDSYRISPTATEFYLEVPIFSDKKCPFFPTYSYVTTSKPLHFVSVHPQDDPLPFRRPPDPVPPPPHPTPPGPAGPVERRLPQPGTKRPNFTDTITEFLPTATGFGRQLALIPPGQPACSPTSPQGS